MGVTPKLTGFIFITTILGIVSALHPAEIEGRPLVRLNIRHDKLKQMCEIREENLYKTILLYEEMIDTYLSAYSKPRSDVVIDDNDWKEQSRKQCEADSNLKSKLGILLIAVNLCLDEKDHLSDYQEDIFISRLLTTICKLQISGGRKIHNSFCLLASAPQRHVCGKKYREMESSFLPLTYNSGECSEARKMFDCQEEALQVVNCDDPTRNAMKVANNITFYDIYGCGFQEPDFDSIYDNEEIMRKIITPKTTNIERFSVTKSKLLEECGVKGSQVKKNLDNSLAEYITVSLRKQVMITLTSKLLSLTDKKRMQALVDENCYNDADIKKSFEKIFDSVQQCLDERYHLDEERKAKMLKESIQMMCSGLERSFCLIPTDPECFHDVGIFLKKAMCNKRIVSDQVYASLPLAFIPSLGECDNIYRMQDCELDIFEDCKASTKVELRKQSNQMRTLFGCSDRYNISEES